MLNTSKKLHSYSKIWNLSHRAVSGILNDTCIVEEKIDGSQFSFGVRDGELYFRSKGAVIFEPEPPNIFKSAVEAVRDIHNSIGLRDGWVYRAEAIKGRGHNTLTYERAPKSGLVIWDIDKAQQDLLGWEDKKIESDRLGLEVTPVLYEGKVTISILDDLLKSQPMLGGKMVEGLVIKRLYDNTIYGRDGKVLVGKYVSEQFREHHKSNPEYKKANKKDIVTMLVEQYATEARWQKSVQHLEETGELNYVPQDIPKILKAVNIDIIEECADDIKEVLFKHYWKQLSKGFTRGLPVWWKDICNKKTIE